MNLAGTVGGKGEVGRERGFSLKPTRVKSGWASHHSARRGFPSKYEGEFGMQMKQGKRKRRGGNKKGVTKGS
jgi:hypothetical protein